MKTDLSIVKCDHLGAEVIRYPGRLVEEDDERIVVEAHFRPEPVQVGSLLLEPGDRFVESYFPGRWYNIYAIYGGRDDALKGWYCNISYPPEIGRDLISYRDLALDLVVTAAGEQQLLDEDEFEALAISAADREQALGALEDLRAHFREKLGQ